MKGLSEMSLPVGYPPNYNDVTVGTIRSFVEETKTDVTTDNIPLCTTRCIHYFYEGDGEHLCSWKGWWNIHKGNQCIHYVRYCAALLKTL